MARWRIVVAVIAVLVVFLAIDLPVFIFWELIPASRVVADVTHGFVSLVTVSVTVWGLARWLRADVGELGLRFERATIVRALVGTALGAGLAAYTLLFACAFGGFVIHGVNEGAGVAWPILLGAAGSTALHAVCEEVALRAGITGFLRDRFSMWAVVLVPATLFGLLHVANPGASLLGIVNIVIVGAGFGVVFLTGARPPLGLLAGIHFGWNEALFRMGLNVSGTQQPGSLLAVRAEPNAWSGYEFGLEASPAATLVFTFFLAGSGFMFWRSMPLASRAQPPGPGGAASISPIE